MNNQHIKYSVVLPVHNEEGNLLELHRRLSKVMRELNQSYEIIYIENRSSDRSVEILKSLEGCKVIIMRLAKEGNRTTQSIALDAGIKNALGEIIITMDSDLQNPPEEIPKLLKKLETENLDVVSGWRKDRKDKILIRLLSKFGSSLRKRVINPGVHDLGCTLKVYRRECFDGINLYGEMHRYLVAILKWRGFSIGEVIVKHHQRTAGNSSYNWRKMFRGFSDMWIVWFWKKYSDRPLHLFGVGGIFFTLLGGLLLLGLGILRILEIITLADSIWPLISILFIISGIQLFMFGILIDLIIKQYYATSTDKPYRIKEIIETKQVK